MLFGRKRQNNKTEANAALLNASIQDWRQHSEGSAQKLSTASRAQILRSIRAESSAPGLLAPLASLFVPARRIFWAAGLPAVALLLVVASFMYQPGSIVTDSAATLNVSRVGDEIVFEIANGGRAHRVFRSDSPEGLAAGNSSEVFALARNTFRDRIDSESGIVFYRVD